MKTWQKWEEINFDLIIMQNSEQNGSKTEKN